MNNREVKELFENLNRVTNYLTNFDERLRKIERALNLPGAARFIEFYSNIGGVKTKVDHMILQPGENAELSLAITDEDKNPARVEGDKVEWILSGDAIGELQVAGDGMSALFVANGAIGKALVQAKGDADLGEGVREIVGQVELERLPKEAMFMELTAKAVAA